MTLHDILNETWNNVPVTSTGTELSVTWDSMNLETIAHLAWHGLKQKVNDPNGAKTLSKMEKDANSDKVLKSLERNEFRIASTRASDPVDKEYKRLALMTIVNKLEADGFKIKNYKMAELHELAEEYLTKYPAKAELLMAQAEKKVADETALLALMAAE